MSFPNLRASTKLQFIRPSATAGKPKMPPKTRDAAANAIARHEDDLVVESDDLESDSSPYTTGDETEEEVYRTLSITDLNNFAKTIATAVAAAISAVRPASPSYPITHSSALDPYDNTSFDVSTKEGKYAWATVTKMQDGWKPLTCSTETANQFMDLFKDRQTQFGLDNILRIPTKGNGKIQKNPRTLGGVEHWDADLRDFKNVLIDVHSVTFDQVRAWSAWIYGGEAKELSLSNDMKIHAIDPNKVGNQGLVNRYKIRLRRLSGALHFIAKNHLKRTSYNSFYPRKELFLYLDEATGREYVCGITFLKMMMEVMKPHLVVDHRAKETELEKMTLASYNNDVRTLLTSMQEKRNEIDTLRKDGVRFDEQRFLTLIFDRLLAAKCKDFLSDIKSERRKWVKDPPSVNSTTVIAESINLYINYKATGEWDAEVVDKDAVIVALATKLKASEAKKAYQSSMITDSKSKVGYQNPLPDWRINKKGPTYTHEGIKYDWCPHHGPKNRSSDKRSSGMYMPAPHKHDEWLANKKAKQAERESKISAGGTNKRKSKSFDSDVSVKRAATDGKLALSKTFKSALVSKLQLSDAEVNDVIATAMKASDEEENIDDDGSSKE